LRGTRILKRAIAWSAVVLLPLRCAATTIVTLITTHGIVICADGKVTEVTSKSSPNAPATDAGTGEKLFVIQDRFVVEHGGIKNFHLSEGSGKNRSILIPYSSDRIVSELRRDASPMFTVSRVAELISAKLVEEFKGFDILPQSGSFRPEHLQPPTHRVITEFTISGYDGQTAHVYGVGVEMDWKALAHRVTPVTTLYPEQEKRKYLSTFISGHSDAIMELYQRSAQGSRQFAAKWPLEYSALGNERDLEIDGMIVLARALLSVQIARSPNDVGYPLKVIVIPKDGRIRSESYKK
jgi:hypothetical protein